MRKIREEERSDPDGHLVYPAVWECDCGEELFVCDFTNTCDGCGADYNWNGTRLASRDQWGEETGEHWSEIY